jgi:hypothetical protein
VWSWPPPSSVQWGAMPGPGVVAWTWQAGWQSALSGSIRLASLAPSVAPNPPGWVYDVSVVTVEAKAPLSIGRSVWRQMPKPDFRIPAGASRFAGMKTLDPPARFLRWSDRLETALPLDRDSVQEVTRRCQAVGAKPIPPAGWFTAARIGLPAGVLSCGLMTRAWRGTSSPIAPAGRQGTRDERGICGPWLRSPI